MRYLITCFIVLLIVSTASAQDTPTCATADDELFLRDDWANSRISLVSWHSGETLATLESDLAFSSYQFVDWSAGCHYALAGVDGQTLAWDVQAGVRVGTLDAAPTPRVRTHWSPDGNRLVLQTHNGGYLWPMGADPVLLESAVDGYGRSFFSTEWDTQRNELLAVQVSTPNGVTAYDFNGQQVGFFHIGDRRGFVEYRRIENNQSIFVYSSNVELENYTLPYGLALWSRDGSRQMQMDLPAETHWLERSKVEFSPLVGLRFDLYGGLSAQYFALNSIGSDAAYAGVWNVELSSDPLQPVATYNGARRPHLISHIDYIRVENGFLDVADWSWQESQLRVERIQLGTNESVYESRLFLAENCPEVSHDAGLFTELYTWACGTPGRDYGWTLPFPDRAYQNGENNALIWIRQ